MRLKVLSIAAALVLLLTACGGLGNFGEGSSSSGSTDHPSDPIMEEPLVKEAENDGHCRIGILTFRDHRASDETIEGFKDEFRKRMGSTEVEFEKMTADGDADKCAQIATDFANNGYKLIFACGSEAVQNSGAAVKDVPIIGACVTDFLLAEVVSSLEAPGSNISGVSSMGPVNLQIDQIVERLPWPAKAGILVSGTEVGSRFQASIAAQCLAEKNIEYEIYNGDSADDIREQMTLAASECSCIYIPTDSIIASNMDIVKEISLAAQVPVITADYQMCRDGGLFCYSIDYEEHGREAAEMAFEVIGKDEEISRLAVREEDPEKAQQYYNPEMAEALNWYDYGGMTALVITPEEESEEENDDDDSSGENQDEYSDSGQDENDGEDGGEENND